MKTERSPEWKFISGTVVRGHQVASGAANDFRFPGGTLAMQAPHFAERGLEIRDYHLATLNVSIAPLNYQILQPHQGFRDLKWHPTEPAEDFSFFDCEIIEPATGESVTGLIYYPHPETKPEHEQPVDVLELLAKRKLKGIEYGTPLEFGIRPDQIATTAIWAGDTANR